MDDINTRVTVSQKQLAAAFTEWDRRFREEPARFLSEAQRVLTETPETYGEACAPYLLAILHEQGFPEGITIKITAQSVDGIAGLREMLARAIKRADEFFRPRGEPRYATGGMVEIPYPWPKPDRAGEVIVSAKKPSKARKPANRTAPTADDEL